MSAYMKFFAPSKKSVTDQNGGMINYPEICIDTNPRFEHKLTAHEIIILDQAAELEKMKKALRQSNETLKVSCMDDIGGGIAALIAHNTNLLRDSNA